MRARRQLLFLNNQGLGALGGGVTMLRNMVAEFLSDFDVVIASHDAPVDAPGGVRQVSIAGYVPAWNWRIAAFDRAAQLCSVAPHDEIAGADLVVAMDPHYGATLGKTRPKRLVYLSLSCVPRQEWFNARGTAAAWGFIAYALLERCIASAADQVVVSSELHARELRRYELLPRLRPVVIHPVYSSQVVAPRQHAEAKELRLLAAGRLVPGKGFLRLVEVMGHLRDVDCSLTIAGNGPERSSIMGRIAELGLEGRIHLAGPMQSMVELFARSDLLLHPSRYESFGMTVFEAQRAGVLPLCDSRAVAGYREFTHDGVDALFVDYRDPRAVAQTVRALALDPGRLAAMATRAAASATARAALDHARQFRTVVEQCLQGECMV